MYCFDCALYLLYLYKAAFQRCSNALCVKSIVLNISQSNDSLFTSETTGVGQGRQTGGKMGK